MEKEFIPYNEALALKELGFNESCFGYYNEDYVLLNINPLHFYSKNSDVFWNSKLTNIFNKSKKIRMCAAPLYQQAFKWFRDKYDFHAEFLPRYNPKKLKSESVFYSYSISNKDNEYDGYGDNLSHWIGIYNGSPYNEDVFYHVVNSYEEAELACLRKLIEIVKSKPHIER